MQNLLRDRDRQHGKVANWGRMYPLLAFVMAAALSGAIAKGQAPGDPNANPPAFGPKCPTCPIVIASRPTSMKDKEDRAERTVQKRNYDVANAARKKFIDDETNKMIILARDLKAKIDGLGSDSPSPTMLREAQVIEFLAKDIKEKMKLTVNPD